MSYILDALRKADAQRARDPARGIHAQPARASMGTTAQDGGPRAWWWAAGAAGFAVVAVAGWYGWRGDPKPARGDGSIASVTSTPMLPPPAAPTVPQPAAAVLPPPVIVAPAVTAPTRAIVPAQATLVAPAPAAGASTVPPAQAPGAAARVIADPMQGGAPTANMPPGTAAPGVPAPMPPSMAPAAPIMPAPPPPHVPRVVVPPAPPPPPVAGLPPDAPKIVISGGVYSTSKSQRMLIVNGQVVNEGADLGSGVTVEEIRPKSAVLRFRGGRYTVSY